MPKDQTMNETETETEGHNLLAEPPNFEDMRKQ